MAGLLLGLVLSLFVNVRLVICALTTTPQKEKIKQVILLEKKESLGRLRITPQPTCSLKQSQMPKRIVLQLLLVVVVYRGFPPTTH